MIKIMQRLAVALSLLVLGTATSAVADPIAEFYKGKQIRFIIRSNVGGTYDLYARAARPAHVAAHPGQSEHHSL